MSLSQELGLKRAITPLAKEAVLNIYYTASCLKKKADEFFGEFGLSDVQFNVMLLLTHQAGGGGLSQGQISKMMLVNRANITGLIDRMEKNNLVVRTQAPGDRRSNIVKLTGKSKKLLNKVEPLYLKKIKNTAILKESEHKQLIKMLEKIRENLAG